MNEEFLQELLENIAWWSLGWFALLAGLLNLTQGIWGWLSAVCLLLASIVTLPSCRSWLTTKIVVLQVPKLAQRMTFGAIFLLLLGVLLTPVSVTRQTTLASEFASEDRSKTIVESPIANQSTETVPLIVKLISSFGN